MHKIPSRANFQPPPPRDHGFPKMSTLQARLDSLSPQRCSRGSRRGIEKESLRVRPDGMLGHPASGRPGSALTHPHITTDFSESQLELITGVHANADACVAELTEIHQIVYRHVGDELLWGTSMPCGLPADDDIPLGRYGRSNLGRAKTVYRNGLAHRYGRRMQTISGVHYNFSMPDAAWPILQQAEAAAAPHRLPDRRVFSPDPQLQAPFLAAALPVRRVADGMPQFRRRPAARTAGVQHRHAVPARGHLLAHGAAGLSERCAGIPRGELQQSEELRGIAQCSADQTLSAV